MISFLDFLRQELDGDESLTPELRSQILDYANRKMMNDDRRLTAL